MNLNCSDFLILKCRDFKGEKTFILDTQADISVIKLDSVINKSKIDTLNTITIRGVTNGKTESHGSIDTEIMLGKGVEILHKFHVVENDFGIPSDGIIGRDFIREYNCKIDYETNTLEFYYDNLDISLTIHDTLDEDTIVLPARAEVFRYCYIPNFDQPKVIMNDEIDKDVFIATTVAYSPKIFVRILNTSEEIKIIKNRLTKVENLNDYDVFTLNKHTDNRDRKKQIEKIIDKNNPEHIKYDLTKLCQKYSHIFALPGDTMTQNNFYKQKLRLSDNTPTYCRNYRMPQSHKIEINNQVENLLKNDLIEPSQSPYNSPIILVPKKSESSKWRMCIDYRLLNKKLIPDKHPLPRIDEILDSLGNTKYFSILDLFSGFHQIPLDKESRECTAFSTEKGSFQWKRLPFGLSVAPNSFCRMMSMAFSGTEPQKAFLYMDDIIVLGKSEKDHLVNLENIFQICQKFQLKLNPQKCNFFKHEVTFLGHRCTQNGLLPNPLKIEAIKRYPKPENKDQAKSFSALTNYYRRFIKNYAEIVSPINALTRKKAEFKWNEKCQKSFQKLKNELISPKILKYPDFSKQFIVTVDASRFACGAVLSQIHNGIEYPISYISRSFQKGELNKSTIMKELLGIHFAITYLRPYLYGTKFIVRSDHKPLVFLYNVKNPASKLTQIRLDLSEYNFTIEHIPGKSNVVADALSRIHIEDVKNMKIEESIYATTRSMTRKNDKINDKSKEIHKSNTNESKEEIKCYEEMNLKLLKNVHEIKTYFKRNNEGLTNTTIQIYKKTKLIEERKINNMILPNQFVSSKDFLIEILQTLQNSARELEIEQFKIMKNDEIFTHITKEKFLATVNENIKDNMKIILIKQQIKVDDLEERKRLIEYFHGNELFGGHFGITQVITKLKKLYYWPNMSNDIRKYINNCEKCRKSKVEIKTKEPMKITDTPHRAFDTIVIDTVGPLNKISENSYALTMICEFSKFLISIPIANKEAKTIAKAIFENCICTFGIPKIIKTDCGTEYKNSIVKELCKILKIQHDFSTPYHHESVGTIERNHRVLNEYLRSYLIENNDWEFHLRNFTFCYNISYNASLNHDYTPFEIVFGKSCNLPNELSDKIEPIYNYENYVKILKNHLQKTNLRVKELIEKSKERNKKYYDRNINPINLKTGDQVMMKKEPYNKHQPIYDGPFEIIELDNENVKININNKLTLVHKNRLIKA